MKAGHWNFNRTRLVPAILLPTLILACASSQKITSPKPLEIPADIAGIVHAGQTNTPEEYALLESLGAAWTLATFYWSRIEPSDNQWYFDDYDKFVDTAKASGKKVLGVLGYDVSWIHDDGTSHYYIPPEKADFFLDFVRKTTEHFQGRVDAWSIWNEPNASHFWKGGKEDFFYLSRLAANAVREVDPDAALMGGAFTRGIFGLQKAFIRGLFESGAMEKTDAVAFHPYEINPSRALKLYGKFRALAAEYGFADRIWITEVGYPTGGWYPTAAAEKKFPAYVVKTFVYLAASGANRIFWYQLFDPAQRKKINSEDYFGLVRSENDYTSKGAEAFRLCAVYLAGTVYRPDLPLREKLPHSLQAFYFEQPDGSGGALALWKEGIPTQVKLQSGNNVFTAHDPVTGAASEIFDGKAIKVGTSPVFITWQGDYQLRLAK
ncbi:MAG: hypothetical protein LBG95_02645 [Treponema sp.]|nr:hypothetical protein [Treponema sp.]